MSRRISPLVLLLLLAACPRTASDAPPPVDEGMSRAPPPDRARAHYEGARASPLVKRFCAARPGDQAKLCERFVGGAEAAGAIALSAAAVDACLAAPRVKGPSCPAPTVCASALEGKRAAGQACRSSLECAAGLSCFDLGVTVPGTCGPARALGARCQNAPDVLAVATGVDVLRDHAPCRDYCARSGRCERIALLGQRCQSHAACGKGAWCGSDKTCRPGSAPVAGCD